MFIKDLISTVAEDERLWQKCKIKAAGPKYQAWSTEDNRSECQGPPYIDRRNRRDVPMLSYCMLLGTVKLGKVLAEE